MERAAVSELNSREYETEPTARRFAVKRGHFTGGDLTAPPIDMIAKGMLAPLDTPFNCSRLMRRGEDKI